MQIAFLPLIAVMTSLAITPGPNNMMLTASGATFGYRRTLPHILGVTLGMLMMVWLAAFGLGALFEWFPHLQSIMKWLSLSYLAWLSWKVATNRAELKDRNANSRPLRLYEGLLFQLINPKAFAIVTTLVATFSLPGEHYFGSVVLISIICSLVCFPSISTWTLFGTMIRKVLSKPQNLRRFNIAMGVLTFASGAIAVLV